MDYSQSHFLVSTDQNRLDIPYMHQCLSEKTYWATGRLYETVERSVRNSMCFGMYDTEKDRQIGFARIITDYITFAWLADVFIDPDYRGQGLGKWLVECVTNDPELNPIRRFLLATKDAEELYTKYGFTPLPEGYRYMQRMQDVK
ncbi:GNAT family N-acetyltransferase [Phototrophicus methaneseepsis]|uniref:GNAT family N-acetyltransferase n=1 Tax=Phototrophicus methaneseepsis TaxID=2710758 RepID=A0A7S8IG68_9CHLR|nr:GNAT family N-acetyltransferase [Phototrophicus methaneseepsis]QPC84357.1 GNAT family N-acetyltransferase [Phototrophicus methaneseepsis]